MKTESAAITFVAFIFMAIAFIAGRATSPDQGVTWQEAETLVCTPLELQHTPAAEFSL